MKTLPSRRRLLVLALVGAAALGGWAVVFPLASGRTRPPAYSMGSAREAVEKARAAAAATWAPHLLLKAEAALRASLTEHRRQEVRFVLRRNFAVAREGFRIAESKAEAATAAAVAARSDARQAAGEALQEAELVLGQAEDLAGSVPLPVVYRIHLRQSGMAFAEAKLRHSAEEFGSAAELAHRATEEARKAQQGAVSLASRFVDRDHVRRWRGWIDDTVKWSRKTGGAAIVVYKEKNLLQLFVDGKQVRSYSADMGRNRLNAKVRAGDNATPEGRYRIVSKKGNGASRYYKALLLDYPNKDDRRRSGRAHPGGLIEIHGEGGRGEDWTNGCVALSNPDMDHLFARVPVGAAVTIVGGDGRGGAFSDIVLSQGTSGGGASR